MRALDRIGVTTILAKYRNQYRNKRILFPGYLFVDIVADWWKIPRVDYIRRLLRAATNPANSLTSTSPNFRPRCAPMALSMDTQERFHIGQRVQILRGAFRDIIANYDGLLQAAGNGADQAPRPEGQNGFQPGDLASA